MRTAQNQMWRHHFEQTATGPTITDRVSRMLLAAIEERILLPGNALPSTRDLAVELGVARNTVLKAMEGLVDAGVLSARARRGYYVEASYYSIQSRLQQTPQPRRLSWHRRFNIRPTTQRNIIKPPYSSNVRYPFTYGQIDPLLFRHAEWRACNAKALRRLDARLLFDDQCDRDDMLLIEQIRTRLLPRRGVWAKDTEILVTMGAQQAHFMLAALFVKAGDRVGIEDPGYPDARNIFALNKGVIQPAPVGEQGLAPQPELIGCKLVYLTPSHQCPTTVTMPLNRRHDWLEFAARHDIVLVEDDYETELTYDGNPQRTLKSLDAEGRVIYVGSLSKSFAPGIRIGYVVADEEVISELRALRRLMLRHPPTITQRALSLFLSEGHYDIVSQRMRHAFRMRGRELDHAIARYLPDWKIHSNNGGSSRWITLPKNIDAQRLAANLSRFGVLVEPGAIFYDNPSRGFNMLRMGFSSIPVEQIEPGVRLIRELLDNS